MKCPNASSQEKIGKKNKEKTQNNDKAIYITEYLT